MFPNICIFRQAHFIYKLFWLKCFHLRTISYAGKILNSKTMYTAGCFKGPEIEKQHCAFVCQTCFLKHYLRLILRMNFRFNDMIDVKLAVGECGENHATPNRRYQEEYLVRRIPNRKKNLICVRVAP